MRRSQPDHKAGQVELLSVVIPARNEENCIASTVEHLDLELRLHDIPHEIVVVDDGSTDSTWLILNRLKERIPALRPCQNRAPYGFGRAVIQGLDQFRGDAVVIMMADESDDNRDVVKYWHLLKQGYECVFGSRFVSGGGVIDYPRAKLVINRLANLFIRLLFGIKFSDITNAFKAYRREVVDGCRPLISPHFNLTVELPLKAILRGFSWTTTPITWRNRRTGVSKLKIKEMGSRYLFICMYAWLEKYFSRGDYRRSSISDNRPGRPPATTSNGAQICGLREELSSADAYYPNQAPADSPEHKIGWNTREKQIGNGVLSRTEVKEVPLAGKIACMPEDPYRVDFASNRESELASIYGQRFEGKLDYRNRIWRVLIKHFFQLQIPSNAAVLDLGCGYGEFINNVDCRLRFAMDLNPNTAKCLAPNVCFLQQDCSTDWNLPDGSLDVVFTSNFFEHLPDKRALASTLCQTRRCLRPGGKFIAIGPNIKCVSGDYWDFWDHLVPLTETSMQEALKVHGFEVTRCIARFLPYTMVGRLKYPTLCLRIYLKLPLAWRVFGKQFLLTARIPVTSNRDQPGLLPSEQTFRAA